MQSARVSLLALLAGISASVGIVSAGAGAQPSSPVASALPGTTYARHLADIALAAYPRLRGLDVYAGPSGGVRAGGDEIDEPLLDVSGAPAGVLALHFAPGTTPAESARTAGSVQKFFSAHVLSEANLRDPYPYSTYPTDTAARLLVERTMARHPEIIVLGMHVSLPGRGNVMLASNIGRVGKKADDDDMRVVNTGASNFEVAENGRRYEVELVLENAAKENIGALGVVFRYRNGDDKNALNARAVSVRDEMARAIPSAVSLLAPAASGPPLIAAGVTSLPGYSGDFDHFAADVARGRLYLAGEDGATLEVFSLKTGALERSIKNFGVPHSILLLAARRELLVVDGTKPSPVFDADTLVVKRRLKLPPGADSIDFDASTGHVWVVTGGKDLKLPYSDLIEVDPVTGRIFNRVHFATDHVEALAVEQHGTRLFINVTSQNVLDTIDKRTGKILARRPISEARENAPLVLDERTHRLFVVTRKPGKLLLLGTDGGPTIAAFDAPGRADQVVWDAVNRQIYVPGGQGYIGVYRQDGANRYVELPRVTSATGAKTAVIVPQLARLYVAQSPGSAPGGGKLLRFVVVPRR